jgi:hypothetical protein
MADGYHALGKILVLFGLIIAGIGVFMMFSVKLPWLGKLPGDIVVQKKNFSFYFPLATCLAISILLTLLLWLIGRRYHCYVY